MHGTNPVDVSFEIGGKTITLSTGKYAKQASGAVVVAMGDSRVLCTTVCSLEPTRFDFLPLTVDYRDMFGAAGGIPGGFLKREGRGSERETLISRLIDRPIRPMFPKLFRNELQIIATVMSYDKDAETDVLALIGASAATYISDAPMTGAVAGVRVCRVADAWVLNPTKAELDAATINLVIAGTADAITMVEGGAAEASEEEVLDALDLAHAAIKTIVAALEELHGKAGKPRLEVPEPAAIPADVKDFVFAEGKASLVEAMAVKGKHDRKEAMKAARDAIVARLVEGRDEAEVEATTEFAKEAWSKLIRHTMRTTVLDENRRLDGRKPADVRAIWCEVGMAPRAHGSGIFTRGETQAFVTCALGTDSDAQLLDYPSGKTDRTFMLTYNFLPYCTGEARPLRAPKRREVGHGALAHRALQAVIPEKADFPYVLRLTSEVMESNGSSSMATVCGGTMALMDAGVPIKAPVAGIAMGLIKEGDRFAVISDILGDEDALGDMDFKVTGTAKGITAFQMDTKIAGVSREVMAAAMSQARDGRLHILDEMAKSLSAPRDDLSPFAPRITTVQIKPDKIRDIIGPGGKTIRGIQEACGVKISVDDSGKVDIASSSGENTEKAVAMIREITQEAEIGALYLGVVKRIVDFGAFVEIFPGTDGLIHISHLAEGRVEKVRDVLNEGDEVLVRVIDIDRSGKIRLSRKEALASAGA
ncbi:MAG: polyribonucleotide nucleotidyltransferase [Alphaproteobacteria bacterium]|nr:polyribonucleotide nucleotidyltransferase [Alphaproteobacteria bacterium]